MKRALFILLGLCFASTAALADDVHVEGEAAHAIAHSLWNTSGTSFCTDTVCGFHIDHVKCTDAGVSAVSCQMQGQYFYQIPGEKSFASNAAPLKFESWRAKKLMQTLMANGREQECNDQTCTLEVNTVDCTIDLHPRAYHCDLDY